jgi:hypothetical protein
VNERELAYKQLRGAAHRLLCHLEPLKYGGYKVRPNFINALDRALTEADLLEGSTEEDKEPTHK